VGFIEEKDCVDLECDRCGIRLNKETRTHSAARSIGKSLKWKFTDDEWVCLSCLEKEKRSNRQQNNSSNFSVRKPLPPSKKRIPHKTTKQKEKELKYSILRIKQLEESPKCQFPNCNKQATEVHHVKGHDGDNMYGPFKSLCNEHHAFVEKNREWAKENGFSESRHWTFETRSN
jgi:hypothetical protein